MNLGCDICDAKTDEARHHGFTSGLWTYSNGVKKFYKRTSSEGWCMRGMRVGHARWDEGRFEEGWEIDRKFGPEGGGENKVSPLNITDNWQRAGDDKPEPLVFQHGLTWLHRN